MVVAALWCVAAFIGVLVLAYFTGIGRWVDNAALHEFMVMHRDRLDRIASFLVHLCDPGRYAVGAVAVILLALLLRGVRSAAAVGFLIFGANATSQLLKPALAYHRELWHSHWHMYNLPDAGFPSGHATAAMTISMAVLIIAPRAARPLVATLGMAFTIGVSLSIVILHWHFPSDVIGGFLVATAWSLVTFAALIAMNERWPERGTMRQKMRESIPAPSPATIAKLAVLGAIAVAVVAASRAHQIASFADRHTAASAVVGAIVVAAAVLLAAVVSISNSRSRSR